MDFLVTDGGGRLAAIHPQAKDRGAPSGWCSRQRRLVPSSAIETSGVVSWTRLTAEVKMLTSFFSIDYAIYAEISIMQRHWFVETATRAQSIPGGCDAA